MQSADDQRRLRWHIRVSNQCIADNWRGAELHTVAINSRNVAECALQTQTKEAYYHSLHCYAEMWSYYTSDTDDDDE